MTPGPIDATLIFINDRDESVTDFENLFKDIRDHIEWLVAGSHPAYFGPENALLKFGKRMTSVRDRPGYVPLGAKRQCYANCAKTVLLSPPGREALFYAEGFATHKDGQSIPMQHAWLVDSIGNVIDPTWEAPHDHLYFGIVFRTAFVVEMLSVSNMEPGLLSAPTLMRRHFGSPALFEATLNPLHNVGLGSSNRSDRLKVRAESSSL